MQPPLAGELRLELDALLLQVFLRHAPAQLFLDGREPLRQVEQVGVQLSGELPARAGGRARGAERSRHHTLFDTLVGGSMYAPCTTNGQFSTLRMR